MMDRKREFRRESAQINKENLMNYLGNLINFNITLQNICIKTSIFVFIWSSWKVIILSSKQQRRHSCKPKKIFIYVPFAI